MEEQWKKIKLNNHFYFISNYGNVWSCVTNNFVGSEFKSRWILAVTDRIYFVDKLVNYLFNKGLRIDTVIHNNYDRMDNYNENLTKVANPGEAVRYFQLARWRLKKQRGVNIQKIGKKRYWRSILFVEGQHYTKYFDTKKDAQLDFALRYKEWYGRDYYETARIG